MVEDESHSSHFSLLNRLPIIRQNEVTECGNACLAMIASYYGFKTDIMALRARFPSSNHGLTMFTLAENARKIGLATRGVKVELEQISLLSLPAILHWNLNHFVVLKSINKNKFVVHDPAKGVCKLSREEFSEAFTGVALELTTTSKFTRSSERSTLQVSSLWGGVFGMKRTFLQLIILSIILQAYILVVPQYMQFVIDKTVPSGDESLLLVIALAFGGLLMFNEIAKVIRSLLILYAGSSIGYQMAVNLFSHLMRLPLSFFGQRHVGDVVSRFGSLSPIRTFLTDGLVGGLIDGLMAIITLIMLMIYSPKLTAVTLLAFAIYLVIRLIFFDLMKSASEQMIVAGANEGTNFIETTRGMLTIKAMGMETFRQQRWQNFFVETINQGIRVKRIDISFETCEAILNGIANVVVIYIAAGLVMNTDFTIGMMLAFIAYRGQFVSTATTLVELLIDYKMLSLHIERLSDIALSDVEPMAVAPLNIKHGCVEIKGATLGHEGSPPLFEDLSLKVEAGEFVAITGASGVGKTSLLKTLIGLLKLTEGEVEIDGKNINQHDLVHLRAQVGTVMQDDILFTGSLADNITFFDNDSDREFMIECSKAASIHSEIEQSPMGYNSPVGDMGTALSGGQKQRILLARALYKRPKLLIIDEGTSSLDTITEEKVNTAIQKLGITRIIVAHRAETINCADRVVTLTEDGILAV